MDIRGGGIKLSLKTFHAELFRLKSCYYSKMGVNSYRMKSPAVTKGGRTLATKKITTKIGGYSTKRLVTTHEGETKETSLEK